VNPARVDEEAAEELLEVLAANHDGSLTTSVTVR